MLKDNPEPSESIITLEDATELIGNQSKMPELKVKQPLKEFISNLKTRSTGD